MNVINISSGLYKVSEGFDRMFFILGEEVLLH